MKLVRIEQADFDGQHLRIDGVTVDGVAQSVELPVTDREVFLGWLTAALFETSGDPSPTEKSQKGLIVTGIRFSTHLSADGTAVVGFRVWLPSGGVLQLVLPVAASSKQRLNAIQAHLDQALKEMGAQGAATAQ